MAEILAFIKTNRLHIYVGLVVLTLLLMMGVVLQKNSVLEEDVTIETGASPIDDVFSVDSKIQVLKNLEAQNTEGVSNEEKEKILSSFSAKPNEESLSIEEKLKILESLQ
jgi:hypothetical protein